jgi:hypothetical protein
MPCEIFAADTRLSTFAVVLTDPVTMSVLGVMATGLAARYAQRFCRLFNKKSRFHAEAVPILYAQPPFSTKISTTPPQTPL